MELKTASNVIVFIHSPKHTCNIIYATCSPLFDFWYLRKKFIAIFIVILWSGLYCLKMPSTIPNKLSLSCFLWLHWRNLWQQIHLPNGSLFLLHLLYLPHNPPPLLTHHHWPKSQPWKPLLQFNHSLTTSEGWMMSYPHCPDRISFVN